MANPTINWRRRILLPIWAIRICLMVVIVVGFSVAMDSDHSSARRSIKYPAAVAFIFFTLLVLLLDIIQIILWARDRLHPAGFAGLTAPQAAFWGLVLLLNIISIAKNQQSPEAMGLVTIMFLLYLCTSIYASIGFVKQRRLAKRGQYTRAGDAGTPTEMEMRYSDSTVDHNDKHYQSQMYRGGDLGVSEPLYLESDRPVYRYTDRPGKFSTVV